MLEIRASTKKIAHKKAETILERLPSIRQIEKEVTKLERSSDGLDRLTAITIRSILNGDTEESFLKAVKVYTKTTKEHVRVA